jgi:hypothetical protein
MPRNTPTTGVPKPMPTYSVSAMSYTQFVYGSPEQVRHFGRSTRYGTLPELKQVDDLDIPEGVTPISLEWVENMQEVGESPEAWTTLAMHQLDRLGISNVAVYSVSENESKGYGKNRPERFLWLVTEPIKLVFPAVDLVIFLNRLTRAEVEAQGLWGCISHMALGGYHSPLTV